MRQSGIVSLNVLVKGRPITEYVHQGQTFLEGRPNSDFEIEIQNHTAGNTMAVVSVDGLSVIDGQPAGDDSAGYLLTAYQKVVIPGWKLDSTQVAKFVFGSRKDSYANATESGDTNCGVIGVMLWGEKQQVRLPIQTMATPWHGSFHGSLLNSQAPQAKSAMRGGMWTDSLLGGVSGSAGDASGGSSSYASGQNASVTASSASVNNLGTGFGQAAEFKTSQVEFEKGAVLATVALFYDDARGLKARGIVIAQPSRARYQTTPNPFPASTVGCTPPPGWRPK